MTHSIHRVISTQHCVSDLSKCRVRRVGLSNIQAQDFFWRRLKRASGTEHLNITWALRTWWCQLLELVRSVRNKRDSVYYYQVRQKKGSNPHVWEVKPSRSLAFLLRKLQIWLFAALKTWYFTIISLKKSLCRKQLYLLAINLLIIFSMNQLFCL